MKTLIKAVKFDLINDKVTLFVKCRFIEVTGDFYRYMIHQLCTWESGLRQVASLVWLFNTDNAHRLKGLGKASYISKELQLKYLSTL